MKGLVSSPVRGWSLPSSPSFPFSQSRKKLSFLSKQKEPFLQRNPLWKPSTFKRSKKSAAVGGVQVASRSYILNPTHPVPGDHTYSRPLQNTSRNWWLTSSLMWHDSKQPSLSEVEMVCGVTVRAEIGLSHVRKIDISGPEGQGGVVKTACTASN